MILGWIAGAGRVAIQSITANTTIADNRLQAAETFREVFRE
jgi:hypothetical protein